MRLWSDLRWGLDVLYLRVDCTQAASKNFNCTETRRATRQELQPQRNSSVVRRPPPCTSWSTTSLTSNALPQWPLGNTRTMTIPWEVQNQTLGGPEDHDHTLGGPARPKSKSNPGRSRKPAVAQKVRKPTAHHLQKTRRGPKVPKGPKENQPLGRYVAPKQRPRPLSTEKQPTKYGTCHSKVRQNMRSCQQTSNPRSTGTVFGNHQRC